MPELVEALVEQPGEHRGGAVEGVAGRHAPPAGAGRSPSVRRASTSRPRRHRRQSDERGRSRSASVSAGVVADEVADQREVLDEVAVGVDDRMVEPGPNRDGVHRPILPRGDGSCRVERTERATGGAPRERCAWWGARWRSQSLGSFRGWNPRAWRRGRSCSPTWSARPSCARARRRPGRRAAARPRRDARRGRRRPRRDGAALDRRRGEGRASRPSSAAVAAAIAMQRAVAGVRPPAATRSPPFQIRIGISVGEVTDRGRRRPRRRRDRGGPPRGARRPRRDPRHRSRRAARPAARRRRRSRTLGVARAEGPRQAGRGRAGASTSLPTPPRSRCRGRWRSTGGSRWSGVPTTLAQLSRRSWQRGVRRLDAHRARHRPARDRQVAAHRPRRRARPRRRRARARRRLRQRAAGALPAVRDGAARSGDGRRASSPRRSRRPSRPARRRCSPVAGRPAPTTRARRPASSCSRPSPSCSSRLADDQPAGARARGPAVGDTADAAAAAPPRPARSTTSRLLILGTLPRRGGRRPTHPLRDLLAEIHGVESACRGSSSAALTADDVAEMVTAQRAGGAARQRRARSPAGCATRAPATRSSSASCSTTCRPTGQLERLVGATDARRRAADPRLGARRGRAAARPAAGRGRRAADVGGGDRARRSTSTCSRSSPGSRSTTCSDRLEHVVASDARPARSAPAGSRSPTPSSAPTLLDRMSATRRALAHRRVAEAIEQVHARPPRRALPPLARSPATRTRRSPTSSSPPTATSQALAYESAADRLPAGARPSRPRTRRRRPRLAGPGLARPRARPPGARRARVPRRRPRRPDASRASCATADLIADAAIASVWPGSFFITAGPIEPGLVELCEDALDLLDAGRSATRPDPVDARRPPHLRPTTRHARSICSPRPSGSRVRSATPS